MYSIALSTAARNPSRLKVEVAEPSLRQRGSWRGPMSAAAGQSAGAKSLRIVASIRRPASARPWSSAVKGEAQVGEATVVGGRVGKILDVADRVVGGIADHAAGERREFGNVGRAEGGHAALEFGERIVRFERLAAAGKACAGDGDVLSSSLEEEERIGAEKAVTPHLLAADDALKQAPAGAGIDAGEGRQRRQPVGEQAAPHRNEAVVGRQGPEAGEIGEAGVREGRCRRHGEAVSGGGAAANCHRLPRYASHLHPAGRTGRIAADDRARGAIRCPKP